MSVSRSHTISGIDLRMPRKASFQMSSLIKVSSRAMFLKMEYSGEFFSDASLKRSSDMGSDQERANKLKLEQY